MGKTWQEFVELCGLGNGNRQQKFESLKNSETGVEGSSEI